MSTKLDKTIARSQEKIAEGLFYEAHQGIRTVAARYIRAKSYNEAIQVLYSGAEALLKADQAGSASDLTSYLIDTYNISETKVDSTSRARIIQLLMLFDHSEPTLKRIGQESIAWSSKFGPLPQGDSELHHVLGSIYAKDNEAYEAEKHLLLGTKESPEILANLLFEWSQEDPEAENNAPLYMARGVLGYLALGDIRDAKKISKVFIAKFIQTTGSSPKSFNAFDDESGNSTIYIFPKAPIFDFLQLLIITCQTKSTEMYQRLHGRYINVVSVIDAFKSPVSKIAEIFFGIKPVRQANMLQDLMGSLFGGSN
ncbi:DUF410-domain-containing protein [Nadsonia fulvescens var. elongata DSM 6958]|uniref:DUF410-domain-containing protein n=1 Tax=Nadsonia fulvescens var. elongata DSM 6958 TaxID=857566 RepID=A0A1E3PR73_9ASCO|nr:DUF410-domain-containing protein [Nadsonia fulvescens var. elongata DSM 6958]